MNIVKHSLIVCARPSKKNNKAKIQPTEWEKYWQIKYLIKV